MSKVININLPIYFRDSKIELITSYDIDSSRKNPPLARIFNGRFTIKNFKFTISDDYKNIDVIPINPLVSRMYKIDLKMSVETFLKLNIKLLEYLKEDYDIKRKHLKKKVNNNKKDNANDIREYKLALSYSRKLYKTIPNNVKRLQLEYSKYLSKKLRMIYSSDTYNLRMYIESQFKNIERIKSNIDKLQAIGKE